MFFLFNPIYLYNFETSYANYMNYLFIISPLTLKIIHHAKNTKMQQTKSYSNNPNLRFPIGV